MPHIGWRIGKELLTFDEALTRSRAGLLPYPPALLRALASDRVDAAPTPSSLAGCLRRFELQRTTDYYTAPEARIDALIGTGVHSELERGAIREAGQQEHKMRATLELPGLPEPFNRIELAGTTDHIDTEAGEILDWKTCGYIGKDWDGRQSHKAQVNVYHWLYAQQPGAVPLKTYRIVYVSKVQGYQGTRVRAVSGDLRPLDVTERWIVAQFRKWAEPVSRGALPAPIEDFYATNPKTGGAAGLCGFCDVYAACQQAQQEGR